MLRRRNFSSSFMRQRVRFYQTACGSCSWTKKAATCAGLFASGMLFSYAYSRRMNAEEELVFAVTKPDVNVKHPENAAGESTGLQEGSSGLTSDWYSIATVNKPKDREVEDDVDGLCSLTQNDALDKIDTILKKAVELSHKHLPYVIPDETSTAPTLLKLAVNFYGRAGVTPLMIAAWHGKGDIITYLLESNANPDTRSSFYPGRDNRDMLKAQSTVKSAPVQHALKLEELLGHGDEFYLQDCVFEDNAKWSRPLWNTYFPGFTFDARYGHGLKPVDFAILNKQFHAVTLLLGGGSGEPDMERHAAKLNLEEKEKVLKAIRSGRDLYRENQRKRRAEKPLEARLSERLVGQKHAISVVSSNIRRKENGWVDNESPLVMLFMGSSGIGKTETAKLVARYLFAEGGKKPVSAERKSIDDKDKERTGETDFLFGVQQYRRIKRNPNAHVVKIEAPEESKKPAWERCFIRLDMTEYQDRHDMAKFIGPPPGFMGYEEGGHLTKKLQECTNAVVLLDEVDKAHRDTLKVLLQVFGEGRLTDGQGVTVDCREATFIMTSNLGGEEIADEAIRLRDAVVQGKQGISTVHSMTQEFQSDVIKPILREQLNDDEFIGKINEIVFFLPFTEEEQKQLAERELTLWQQRAKARHNIDMRWSEKVPKFVVEGYDLRYGARSIKYEVDRTCIAPIARAQEEKKVMKGCKIDLDVAGLNEVEQGKAATWWETGTDTVDTAGKLREIVEMKVTKPAKKK